MKKVWLILLIMLMMTGCGCTETFDTIADEYIIPVSAETRQTVVAMPEEASVMTAQTDHGIICLCDGYEILTETFPAGDLDRTICNVTGYHPDELTVLETVQNGFRRHDMVWCSAGEQGNRLGRAAILDDGNYYYVLTVIADEENSGGISAEVDQLFSSFELE